MTNYTITVNGKSYEVTVQKKKDSSATSVSLPTDSSTITPVVPVPVFKSQSSVGGETKNVVAPMPGKVIEIKVRVGDSVKKGQELLIMEAMKMHNPILAASDGVISELFVKINDPVQSGQPLICMR